MDTLPDGRLDGGTDKKTVYPPTNTVCGGEGGGGGGGGAGGIKSSQLSLTGLLKSFTSTKTNVHIISYLM